MNIIKEGEFHKSQIEFSKNGNAKVKVDDKVFFIYKKNTLNSLNLDTVKFEIIKVDNKLEAKVVEILNRHKTEFVGKVQIGKKSTFVVPDNNKIHVDFYIKGGLNAEHDDKVVVELIKWEDTKSPQAKITKILGKAGNNDTEMNSIMFEYGLPVEFPQEVINEAELVSEVITEKEISKRLDLREVVTIGIDPFDSKDADDTIGFERVDNKKKVSINIADVSFYIKEDSELDKEAYRRGTSVYLVDRTIGMLPHRLSNNICSLKSGSDKLCYSVILTFNENYEIVDKWFGRTIVHVNKDYSYEQAQDIIENGVNIETKDTDNVVLELDKIAKAFRKNRIKDSLEINSSEVKFILDKDGSKPTGVYFKEQKDSNKLIEEFMLLANKEVARFIKSKNLPCVNRIHEEPDMAKIDQIRNIAYRLGYELEEGDNLKELLNKLIKEVKGQPEENIINTLITRAQKKAKYSTENIGHYGLGFENYSHYTSPIRRFSDVLTHRLLTVALGNDGYPRK